MQGVGDGIIAEGSDLWSHRRHYLAGDLLELDGRSTNPLKADATLMHSGDLAHFHFPLEYVIFREGSHVGPVWTVLCRGYDLGPAAMQQVHPLPIRFPVTTRNCTQGWLHFSHQLCRWLGAGYMNAPRRLDFAWSWIDLMFLSNDLCGCQCLLRRPAR